MRTCTAGPRTQEDVYAQNNLVAHQVRRAACALALTDTAKPRRWLAVQRRRALPVLRAPRSTSEQTQAEQ